MEVTIVTTKKISILGSTGSIGKSTLDVVSSHPERYQVAGLAAGRNLNALKKQIEKFAPLVVSVSSQEDANDLSKWSKEKGYKTKITVGVEGTCEVATISEVDTVVSAIVGAAGLEPTLKAIEHGKSIALANKETLVTAGDLVTRKARENGVSIFPIDSEHSAIYQSLKGHNKEDVRRLILTASGGPFRTKPLDELYSVTVEQALDHPTWKMGPKITIDSATMMNKGLEVIEARWLFDIKQDRIDVHVHPQSIIHSMVEYIDGSVIAQLGVPDMRGPIAYALSHPDRLPAKIPPLDLIGIGSLTFFPVDETKFPAVKLAHEAVAQGDSMPAVLNAANEVAVENFLAKKIGFMDIPKLIEITMANHKKWKLDNLEDVRRADAWARKISRELISKGINQ